MTDQTLRPGGRYVIKQTSRSVTALIDGIEDLARPPHAERKPAPEELGAERHRPRAPADERAARVRPLYEQPPHRQLHPDRRGHQRHRRRGDDRREKKKKKKKKK